MAGTALPAMRGLPSCPLASAPVAFAAPWGVWWADCYWWVWQFGSLCHRAAFHILVPALGCVRVRTQVCLQPEGGSCRVVVGVFSARLPAGTLT